MTFKGWVPTVNGRLSFKIIGESRHPAEAEYSIATTKTHQYVLACQERNLSDVLFDRIVARLLGVDGHFDFVFCARARRQRADATLIGRVYVARGSLNSEMRTHHRLNEALQGFRSVDFAAGGVAAKALYLEAHLALTKTADMYADVILHRNGLIGIGRVNWNSSEVLANSMVHAEESGTDLDHSIADQIYYFIRDIAHQHQHHGADADTMISTIRCSDAGISWTADIVFALYYHIITIKRRSDPIDHVRVLGVLAYLRSFKSIIRGVETEKGISAEIPFFDDEAAKESITATKNYMELLSSRRRQKVDSFRTVLFAVTATSLTLISFISGFAAPDVQPVKFIQDLADFFSANAYLCFIPLLVPLLWWLSDRLSADRYDVKRDVIRLTLVNRGFAAVVILGFAAIIGSFSIFLGWSGVEALVSASN